MTNARACTSERTRIEKYIDGLRDAASTTAVPAVKSEAYGVVPEGWQSVRRRTAAALLHPDDDVDGALIIDGRMRVAVDAAPRSSFASAFVRRAAVRN
jgi:hypothetical protein